MAEELFTTAGEVEIRLDALTEQWNRIHNAAWGRGTTPLVSQPLAEAIDQQYRQFRQWRDAIEGFFYAFNYADDLRLWTEKANIASRAIQAEGHSAPMPLTEWKATGTEMIVKAVAWTAAAGLSVYLLVQLLKLRRAR